MMKLASVLTSILLAVSVSAQACTLFAAQGSAVAGGGTLIAKNRDFKPAKQVLKNFPRSEKHKYAVYAVCAGKEAVAEPTSAVAGVNEKGLVVVIAMASCIPAKQLEAIPKKPMMRGMLGNCATVEEAVKYPCLGPHFIMVADKNEVAYIEVGLDGKTSVKRVQNGTLAHANHYLDAEFAALNMRIAPSSATRFARATELLEAETEPFTMARFQEISEDRNDGPDNSLWRDGSSENKVQTLGSFIVDLHKDGDFDVYIKYRPTPADKGNETVLNLTKKQIFGK